MSRSRPYSAFSSDSESMTSIIIRSIEDEKSGLDDVLRNVLDIVQLIPLDAEIAITAIEYQKTYGLTPQDAIVFASVIKHLNDTGDTKKCFINRNSKDFDNPDIEERLAQLNCKLITSFGEGYGYILKD